MTKIYQRFVKKSRRLGATPWVNDLKSVTDANGLPGKVVQKLMPENLLDVLLKNGERVLAKPEDLIKMTTTTTVPITTTTTTTAGSSFIPWLLAALGVIILAILGLVCFLNNQKPERKKKKKTRALQPEPQVVEAPAPPQPVATPQWLTAPVLQMSAPVTTHVVTPVQMAQPSVIQYAAPIQYATPTYAAPATYAAPQSASMVVAGSMVATEPMVPRHFG